MMTKAISETIGNFSEANGQLFLISTALPLVKILKDYTNKPKISVDQNEPNTQIWPASYTHGEGLGKYRDTAIRSREFISQRLSVINNLDTVSKDLQPFLDIQNSLRVNTVRPPHPGP